MSALNNPTSIKDAHFVANEAFLESRRNLAQLRKDKDISTASYRHATIGDAWSFTTGSNSWLIVPCSRTSVVTLKNGWIWKVKKNEQKEYSGEYDGTSTTDAIAYLLRVPRTGKIAIEASQFTWVDTSYF